MKVNIDREGCISCGLCVNTCPEVFRFADDGLAEICGDCNEHSAEVKDSAEGCPVNVIHIEE